jgi:hypothetical protein
MAGITIKGAFVDAAHRESHMAHFRVGWSRLEVLPYSADLMPGLQAAIADPLWMLGRQWQLTEFKGNDTGSPVDLRLSTESASLSRFHLGPLNAQSDSQARDLAADAPPLEMLVESEDMVSNNPMLAMRAASHFLRLLNAEIGTVPPDVQDAIRAAYPLSLDTARIADDDQGSKDWATLMNRRAIDGTRLAASLAAGRQPDGTVSTLPDELALPGPLLDGARRAAAKWLAWFDRFGSRTGAGSPAWNPHRLEYALAAQADTSFGPAVLYADEYAGQSLDWYSFDIADKANHLVGSSSETLGEPSSARHSVAIPLKPRLPTPIRYPGMPADRFWEFEDSTVNLPALDAGPGDLARMLLLEFALVYGNDWFFTPLSLPIGSLTRITDFVVRDTFGMETQIRAARELPTGDGRWEIFSLDFPAGAPDDLGNLLFVPATFPWGINSPALEDVSLFRDELANMAWGVEHRVQGISGLAYDRRISAASTLPRPLAEPPQDVSLVYRLMTPTPENWFPFVAASASGFEDPAHFRIRLQRRSMLRMPSANSEGTVETLPAFEPPPQPNVAPAVPVVQPPTIEPRGLVLAPQGTAGSGAALELEEEEVPREGTRVQRLFQACRWIGGSRLVWLGRRKHPGRGEGSSGLRFDVAQRRGD